MIQISQWELKSVALVYTNDLRFMRDTDIKRKKKRKIVL